MDAGDVNSCVCCGKFPCVWGLCLNCRDAYCTQDPKTGKWSRPVWLKALLASHRTQQRRRKDPRFRELSLEEVANQVPQLGYEYIGRGDS